MIDESTKRQIYIAVDLTFRTNADEVVWSRRAPQNEDDAPTYEASYENYCLRLEPIPPSSAAHEDQSRFLSAIYSSMRPDTLTDKWSSLNYRLTIAPEFPDTKGVRISIPPMSAVRGLTRAVRRQVYSDPQRADRDRVRLAEGDLDDLGSFQEVLGIKDD